MFEFQSTEMMFFIYVAVFIGVLLVFDGLRQLLSREEQGAQARNRRMRMLQAGASSGDVLNLFLEERTRGKSALILLPDFSRFLRQAGIQISLIKFGLVFFALGAVIFFFTALFLAPVFALGASIFSALVLPAMIVSHFRTKRIEKLTAQLPDALDLMARGLQVGHPINVTVGSVASEMPDPIGTEFGLIQDQVSYGDEVATAFKDLANRYEIEDLNYLSVSVSIQHGTGGNLARVLKVLSKVIRDRATMRKKIHAISAEGRLSAFILSVLPFAIFGIISVTTPSFYGDVQSDPLFAPFMIAIISLVILQAIILIRLVNFKF